MPTPRRAPRPFSWAMGVPHAETGMDDPLADMSDRYELGEILGLVGPVRGPSGGMSVTPRRIAVKCCAPTWPRPQLLHTLSGREAQMRRRSTTRRCRGCTHRRGRDGAGPPCLLPYIVLEYVNA